MNKYLYMYVFGERKKGKEKSNYLRNAYLKGQCRYFDQGVQR